MQFDSDELNEIFDPDGLAQEATWDGGTINVIFDNDFIESVLGDTVYGHKGPMALCKTSDVSAAVAGNTIITGGVTYTITQVAPGDAGMTLLQLKTT